MGILIFDKLCYLLILSWAEQDVDPSLFSKELMANASRLVDDEEVVFVKVLNLSCECFVVF